MINFLTMKEAATLTGKSPSSIRRIIYPIIHDDKHADRKHVRPTVEEVKQLRTRGENFPWQVSEQLLRREVPVGDPSNKPHSATHGSTASTGGDALVDTVRTAIGLQPIDELVLGATLSRPNADSSKRRMGMFLVLGA